MTLENFYDELRHYGKLENTFDFSMEDGTFTTIKYFYYNDYSYIVRMTNGKVIKIIKR